MRILVTRVGRKRPYEAAIENEELYNRIQTRIQIITINKKKKNIADTSQIPQTERRGNGGQNYWAYSDIRLGIKINLHTPPYCMSLLF